MVSVEDRPTNLARVVVLPLPSLRSDLIRRPGEGLRFGKPMSCAARNPLNSPCQAATAAEANSVPSTSMRCMITASLRASATFAFFMPARLASRIAQLLHPSVRTCDRTNPLLEPGELAPQGLVDH